MGTQREGGLAGVAEGNLRLVGEGGEGGWSAAQPLKIKEKRKNG